MPANPRVVVVGGGFAGLETRFDQAAKMVATTTGEVPFDYAVVSPLWRGGKKLLGLYLPWRFGNGEPFHAGLPWNAMDLGLRAMSRVMAH